MMLIDLRSFGSFEDYLKSLNKNNRKELIKNLRLNSDCEFREIPYDRDLMIKFRNIWEKQTLAGSNKTFKFGYGIEFKDELNRNGFLKCFTMSLGGEVIALKYVEVFKKYVFSHPQMYDKKLYLSRSPFKFMNTSLIRWAIENGYDFVDLGSVSRYLLKHKINTWKNQIIHRAKCPNTKYKWKFIPQEVKKNPQKQEDYELIKDGVVKYLKRV
jgi:hypothetical protein